MKLLTTLSLLLAVNFLFAINTINPVEKFPDLFEKSSESIDAELNDLQELNTLVIAKNYSFDQLQANHAAKVAAVNLSAEEDGLLDSHPDNPLVIAGFWWGFVLGWVGMLIVYLTMDEGEGRKEQVKNALIGCLISAAFWTVLWVVVFAAAST